MSTKEWQKKTWVSHCSEDVSSLFFSQMYGSKVSLSSKTYTIEPSFSWIGNFSKKSPHLSSESYSSGTLALLLSFSFLSVVTNLSSQHRQQHRMVISFRVRFSLQQQQQQRQQKLRLSFIRFRETLSSWCRSSSSKHWSLQSKKLTCSQNSLSALLCRMAQN